jgi:hypothetical protein
VPLAEGDRSALAVAGTEKIRTGDRLVFLKVVAVTPAVVTRDGQVRAECRPYDHATRRSFAEVRAVDREPDFTQMVQAKADKLGAGNIRPVVP